jgi:hypothetical protein
LRQREPPALRVGLSYDNLADRAVACVAKKKGTQTGHRSCADAGSVSPSTLLALATIIGRCTSQPVVLIYRTRRRNPTTPAPERRQIGSQTRHSRPLPAPRLAVQRECEAAASHRAAGCSVLLIDGARTYAHGISAGAVAVFVRFRAAAQRPRVAPVSIQRQRSEPLLIVRLVHFLKTLYILIFMGEKGNLLRRLAGRGSSLSATASGRAGSNLTPATRRVFCEAGLPTRSSMECDRKKHNFSDCCIIS